MLVVMVGRGGAVGSPKLQVLVGERHTGWQTPTGGTVVVMVVTLVHTM